MEKWRSITITMADGEEREYSFDQVVDACSDLLYDTLDKIEDRDPNTWSDAECAMCVAIGMTVLELLPDDLKDKITGMF